MQRKEIENYLIIPQVLYRVINSRRQGTQPVPSTYEIVEMIDCFAEDLKDGTVDAISQEVYNDDRSLGVANANRQARTIVDDAWSTFEGRVSIVSGKDLISKLSGWSQDNYAVSFGTTTLASELNKAELSAEIVEVMRAIESGTRFVS